LILLAIPSVIAGYWLSFFTYLDPKAPGINLGTLLSTPDTWVGVAVSLIGLAWAFYLYGQVEPAKLNAVVEGNVLLRTLHRILYNRYYVDDLYDWLIRYVVLGISHVEQAFDTYIVDGLVNGAARVIMILGSDVRRVETGRVQSYMIGFFGGVAVLGILVFVLVTYVK
jgi:NADH:ubiquinone oxidoreductase subunit 5 (subunit L)/multisubunit Na+/H+ antiporter MnhA subunit